MNEQQNQLLIPGRKEWWLLMTLALVWGPSFFFNRVALDAFPPMTLVLLRVGLAALTLNALLSLLGQRLPSLRDPAGQSTWLAFVAMGCLNNVVPFFLIVWGQTHIASGLAAILNATTPITTMVLAHWLTPDEKMTRVRIAGLLIGFTGVVVLVGPEAMSGFDTPVFAMLAVLGATFSYGCAGIFGRRFKAMGVAPLGTATGQLTASTLLLAPMALWMEQPWTMDMPGVPQWAAVVALALVSTAFAYHLYFKILGSAGATHLLLVTFLMPVVAILLGVVLLGEHLTLPMMAGMALIGLGLGAIKGVSWRIPRKISNDLPEMRPEADTDNMAIQSGPIIQSAGCSAMR